MILKIIVDDILMYIMGYGWIFVVNGDVFSYIFNYSGNYWNGVFGVINYLFVENGGDLFGKKIVLVYYNFVYGKELIWMLEELLFKYGYELSLLLVDYSG